MKKWLAIVILLTLPLILGVVVKRGPANISNQWGIINGTTATDETMEALMNLDHLRGLPNLPRFYFSNGASSTGTATGGGNNTLEDTTNFTADLLIGHTVRITGGVGADQTRKIVANTVTILTVTPAWGINPVSGSTFDVYTGEYPTGVDTNPCTPSKPCLTFQKMEALWSVGNVHLIADAGDIWKGTGDWGNASVTGLASSVACADGQACVVLSGSDFSGRTRPTFDCTGIDWASPGLFASSHIASTTGWVVVQNIQTVSCPDTPVESHDIFRVNNAGNLLVLNVKVPDINGESNQAFTSHSTGGSVVINLEADVGDQADFDADCAATDSGVADSPYPCCTTGDECIAAPDLYAPVKGQNVLITPHELVNHNENNGNTSGTRQASRLLRLTAIGNYFIYGPTVRNTSSSGLLDTGINTSPDAGETQTIAVARTVFRDFDQVSGASAINLTNTNATTVLNFTGFRNTFINNTRAYFVNPSGTGATADFKDLCSLYDENVDIGATGDILIARFDEADRTTVDIQYAVVDEDDGNNNVDSYWIDEDGDGPKVQYKTYAAVLDSGTGSSVAATWAAFFTNSTALDDGNQYTAALEHAAVCNQAQACNRACSVSWSHTFPVAIPKFVLDTGQEITSVFLNRSLDGNIGAR